MRIKIITDKPGLDRACHDLMRALLGAVQFTDNEGTTVDLSLRVSTEESGAGDNRVLWGAAQAIAGENSIWEKAEEPILWPWETANQLKRLAKLAAYRAVLRLLNKEPLPWGILTGIRPTKIVHRLLDLQWSKDKIMEHMLSGYAMEKKKAAELVRVAHINRKFLLTPAQAGRKISVYIGIPFCPTRCAYCSFPAYQIGKHEKLVEPFLTALKQELKITAGILRDKGLTVQTIYIGGGTPTSLDCQQLTELLGVVGETMITSDTEEITLEAGRPDTLTADKLMAAKRGGVTRLSINPQSMNAHTLEIIGRRHSPEAVKDTLMLARETGFDNINMDLIVGLPGENYADVEATLSQIREMHPENLTVHTMAIKRASALKENREQYLLPTEGQVEKMLALVAEFCEEMGQHPYYLYRQKYMVGPMENKGYSLPGYECIYNIQVIEERQTILGLGAGAASKFVNPADWTLTSLYNPKDPECYIQRVEELITKKMDFLGGPL